MANDLALETIQIANGQVGVQEQPRGSNSGPRVNSYLATVHEGPGKAWCSAFACWCVLKASLATGIRPSLKFSASALHLWALNPDLQFHNLDATQDLPAIVIWDHGQGLGHVGLVAGYNSDRQILACIEGNTDHAGGREGYEVAVRERPIADPKLLGFLRIT